jgi:CPA1 family monovalent cation:H+ antiporter
MDILTLITSLLCLAAAFSYLNHRVLGLPTTIGLMAISLVFSLMLILLGVIGTGVAEKAARLLAEIDFTSTLMNGMLGFLLFAGALHVDLDDLLEQWGVIALLSTVGVLMSTALIGGFSYLVLQALGIEVSLLWCVVFGALISPTDPIAVLGILRKASAPKSLETKIVGESLFNDGVGIVVFIACVGFAMGGHGGHEASLAEVVKLFAIEAFGGILFGVLIGWIAYRMIGTVDDYPVEILLSLALVMGGSALASRLHVSAPLAIVVAGLLIGNYGRLFAMSPKTREHLYLFWELVDELMNAILFVLIGLEVLVMPFNAGLLVAGAAMIPAVLLARFVAVGLPLSLLRTHREFTPGAVRILTWGGLRGGISIALALSLPAGPERAAILAITYVVVVFSILVQGLTIGRLVTSHTLLPK